MAGKGRDTEKRFTELAELAGWEYYLPPKAKYRNQDVFASDVFGGFDVILFRPPDRIRGIQIKTNHVSGITEWFTRARRYAGAFESVGFAVLEEEQGWRYAEPGQSEDDARTDGYKWTYDGREPGPRRPEWVDWDFQSWYMTQTIQDEKDSQIDGPEAII